MAQQRPLKWVAVLALVAGCGGPESANPIMDTGVGVSATSSAMLEQGRMIVYEANSQIPQSELMDLGDPAGLGGEVLEGGHVKVSARIDYADANGFVGGIFQATRGKVRIHFPFTEHATIMHGQVRLTDETGQRHTFKPGDSYLIHQGSVILWEVDGARVQKTFFNRHEPQDSPGPMIVYDRGDVLRNSEMIPFPPPAALGGVVLDGNPVLMGRIDYANLGLLAGVFEATRGEVLVTMPFIEHATVMSGRVSITDDTGQRHLFKPGDTYLMTAGTHMTPWDVDGKQVQKSFFNYTAQ